MNQPPLPLDLPEPQPVPGVGAPCGAPPRVLRPVRNHVQLIERDLDSLVTEDHAVRAVSKVVQRLDLSAFYARIKATLERPVHPATDPAVLLAVWVFATSEGVGSARQVARLCAEHDAYRCLCGGIPTNYHTLADFRTAYPNELDRVLTEIVAVLLHAEVVTLKQVAQDGMRVRASAGSGSFHRAKRLD